MRQWLCRSWKNLEYKKARGGEELKAKLALNLTVIIFLFVNLNCTTLIFSQMLKFETSILVGIKKALISKAKPRKKNNMNKALIVEELNKLENCKWPSSNYQNWYDMESRHGKEILFEMKNIFNILSTYLRSLHLQDEKIILKITINRNSTKF